MARILITGIAGFIGSHLAQRMLAEGFEVVGIDNFDPFYGRNQKEANLAEIRKSGNFTFLEADLSNPEAYQSLEGSFDGVFHLAAKAGVLPSIQHPEDYIQANIVGTQHLLSWMVKSGINKLIFASSSSVYGNNSTPFSENDDVSNPISPYAFTKKACELMTHTYHHLHQLDVVNLRFFTVIGERQRPDLAIHKFTKLILENKPVTMYGDGTTARDYTYVGDIVEGLLKSFQWITSQTGIYEIINLGNHQPVSLQEMVGTVYEVMGKKPSIIQMPRQPGDVEITYAEIGKAKKLLGYEPKTDFKTAVQKFVDWFSENSKN